MGTVYLVGLGPGDPQALTIRALALLKRVKKVYVRTAQHPALAMLDRHRIAYKALDVIYQKSATFEEAYRQIAWFILNAARRHGEVAYAVPGSASLAERTVEIIQSLASSAGVCCRRLPAVSFVEAVTAELSLPREEALVVLDALQPDKLLDHPDKHVFVMQAYNRPAASRMKLQLLTLYPPDHPVTAIRGAGLPAGKRKVVRPLYKIDRLKFIDHLTTFYLPPLVSRGVQDLLRVMRHLRSEEGCPWDLEQDHRTLKPYLLEETYEVLGAIDEGEDSELCEELGDLLLQIVFHCQIAAEREAFSFYDSVAGITEKLIRRHPHVFGRSVALTAKEVSKSWQRLKQTEKADRESLFTLERGLPALLRAQKLQRQASSVGFDWPEVSGSWEKMVEELKELQDAYQAQDRVKIEEELGDLLFAVVNVSRFLNVDAEQALAGSTSKFYQRICYVEKKANNEGGEMDAFSLPQLDEWWEEAKSFFQGKKPLIPGRNYERFSENTHNKRQSQTLVTGGKTVNKSELVSVVAEKAGMTKKDTEKVVSAVFDGITEALSKGDKVQIIGFGTFDVRDRKEREGRNPATGAAIKIAAVKAPVFKAGKALKDTVR